MYYALTINNLELTDCLQSINDVYLFIKNYCDNVNYISVERNELNYNIHYHLLVENYKGNELSYIWNKLIDNDYELIKYIDYLKKDGHFKVYNSIPIVKEKWYNRALYLVKEKNTLEDVFEADASLIKYYYQVYHLFTLYNNKKNKKGVVFNDC